MTIKARSFRDDGFQIMVTGTQDPEVARSHAIAEAEDYAESGGLFFDDAKDLDDEMRRAHEWAEWWVDQMPPRLTAGRIVPCDPDAWEPWSWLWWEGLALDRPGAFFALMYDRRPSSPVTDVSEEGADHG